MSKRITLERVLRDDDDDVGQSTREWTLSIDGSHITIRGREDAPVLMIREGDIEQLHEDLLTLASH
ncbi:MAG: hypothetical protein JJ902_04155 [Roseibium sp.]|nr:hypothetical protein [Roseibium sp.]